MRDLVTRRSGNNQFKPDVVLANWAIVHRLWHHTLEEFGVFLKRLSRQLDGMTEEDAHRPRYIWSVHNNCSLSNGVYYQIVTFEILHVDSAGILAILVIPRPGGGI